MATVNLYDVLNVDNDCSRKVLKDAYRELVRLYHPDRPTGDADMFELVTHAYNVLANPTTRAEYDTMYKLSTQSESDHLKLRKNATDYYKSLDTDVTSKSKDEMAVNFKKAFTDMDKKRGYNRSIEKDSIKKKESKKRLKDLELTREQEDTENIHEKLFDNGRFDLSKFNAAFDAMHGQTMDVIPHTGNPTAFNINDEFTNYVNPENYDDLFAEDDNNFTQDYGSINFNKPKTVMSAKDIAKLKEAEYVKSHNSIDKDYTKSLEEKLNERLSEDNNYKTRKFNEFQTHCGDHGIFDKLGLKDPATLNALNWDEEEDIKIRYNKMLEARKAI
jgi:curved DNA-binding protein CbpA